MRKAVLLLLPLVASCEVSDRNVRVDEPFTLAMVPESIFLLEDQANVEILEYRGTADEDWCCIGVQEVCDLVPPMVKFRVGGESRGKPNPYGVDPTSFIATASSGGLALSGHTVALAWADTGLSRHTPDRVVTGRDGKSWRWSDVVNTCDSDDDVEITVTPSGSWFSATHLFHIFDDAVCIQREGDDSYTEPPPPPDPELLQAEVCIPRAEWELGLQRIDAGCAANDESCVVP